MGTITEPQRAREIVDRLRTITPSSHRLWGRMTAHQMICHVADGIRMALDDRPIGFTGDWASTHIVKYVALYAPFPWPKGVKGPRISTKRSAGRAPWCSKPTATSYWP